MPEPSQPARCRRSVTGLASELSLGVAVVEEVLPRRTAVRRKTVLDKSEEQLLASNIDTIFVVSDAVHDLNARRLERYLTIAWDSGADPVIVITKLDLCDDRLSLLEAESVAIGVPLAAVSSVTGEGFDALAAHLVPARTVALIGSSGVGKSTIVNRLLGEDRLATRTTRQDGRGRHVTRHRELYLLPGGALVIDTPGMRELQLWEGDIDDAFPDITELAAACRFTDCAHDEEPGCAVREAVDPARMESYRRLQRELAATEARRSNRLRRELKQRWKQRTRESRQARRHGRL